jgi:2-hydroxy-3-oxopropionate reductase
MIGFIGLGVMGEPMARNLMAAGFDVVVHNRTPKAFPNFVSLEEAGSADVVITMLPDSAAVRSVADAITGSLWIDMSTIHPTVAVELSQRGIATLDAPVSGGDVGAQNGTLSIMVGGAEEDYERALPIFEAVGKTVVHVGGPGAGQVVKACNQIVVALTIEAVSEALVLGTKAGVDPEKVLDVLGGGLAANRVMEMRRRNFLEHDFTPGFRVDLHHKDLNIALESGDAYGVPLPATSLAQQMLRSLRAKGRGADDHTALLTVIEDWAATQEEIPCPA